MEAVICFAVGVVVGFVGFLVLLRWLLSAPAGSTRAAVGNAVIQKAGGPPPTL